MVFNEMKLVGYLCVLLAAQALTQGASKPVRVASTGQTTITGASGTTSFTVMIYTHELKTWNRDRSNPRQPDSNCVDYRTPCSIVDSIRIVENGNPVFVPGSVYADLGDLNDAQLIIGKGTSILRLSGGDGAEGYFVKIEFDAQSVKRRAVASGMDLQHPTEETIYHVVTIGD